MNDTTNSGETFIIGNFIGGPLFYGLGLYLFSLVLILVLYSTAYFCKWKMHRPSPPSFTTNAVHADHHCITITQGLREDILATFPSFMYSEIVMPKEGDTQKDVRQINSYNSSCSICLADYEPTDVLRLLPECGHLFHLSCIDTWLKVHPTCPMCRNSFV